uniref:leucine-rich repeat domain-containing protein n=1 Tax=Leptolyngbya sp. BC1307 TaxID=2029589 RepID=UPI0014828142
YNQLTELPADIGQLSSLQTLDLSYNQLTELPADIGQLSSLQTLDLSSNQLSSLPKWSRALENLETLDLRGNPLPIPPEILGPKESYADPNSALETLGFYFSLKAEEGSVPLYEAKVILVGEGGAGKTSLAGKINDETYELAEDEPSTEGVDVIRWDFELSNGTPFRANIWDFGGQEIYHATHQFFLTKRSLYLLIADTRPENTDFYYWLKIIRPLA